MTDSNVRIGMVASIQTFSDNLTRRSLLVVQLEREVHSHPLQETESKLQTTIDATDPDAEADLRKQVSILKNYRDATNAVVPKPPTITLRRRMTLTHAVQRVYALLNRTEQ